jgi:hypothetical protein
MDSERTIFTCLSELCSVQNKNAGGFLTSAFSRAGENELKIIEEVIQKTPNKKTVAFTLDGLDQKRIEKVLTQEYYKKIKSKDLIEEVNREIQSQKSGIGQGRPLYNISRTEREILFVTSEVRLFDRVRWFKDGRELSFQEVHALFGTTRSHLFQGP